MSDHQSLIEEVIRKIESRKGSYGSILVKSVIMERGGVWKNIVTKILPLHFSDIYLPKKKLDYGNFVMLEDAFSLDRLIEIIKNLPEKVGSEVVSSTIIIQDYQVQVEGEKLYDGCNYYSGTDYLDVGWFFERYHYRSPKLAS